MRTEDVMVLVVWTVGGFAAVLLVATAFAQGISSRSKLTALDWRERKLISTFLSSVSLVLFILSFDQLVRGAGQTESRAYLQDKFLELKLLTNFERTMACAPDRSSNNCLTWRGIDISYQMDFLRQGQKLRSLFDYEIKIIPDEQRNRIEGLVSELNLTMPSASSRSFLSPVNRLTLAFGAIFALILSVAGSLGEAAFQYRQARASARVAFKQPVSENEKF
jgi:hypothetical protein